MRGGGEHAAAARRRWTWRRGHGGAAAAASALRRDVAAWLDVAAVSRGWTPAPVAPDGAPSAAVAAGRVAPAAVTSSGTAPGRPRGTAWQHSAATSGASSRKLNQLLFWKVKLKQLLVRSGAGSGGAERNGAADGREGRRGSITPRQAAPAAAI